MRTQPRGLVAFDLDGTLLRGPTVCQLLATEIGRGEEMKALECLTSEAAVTEARLEMARWYDGIPRARLLASLRQARWAPGAAEGVARLQRNGIEVVIASVTWHFAVAWMGEQLGISKCLGTRLSSNGRVGHVWPRDKGRWVRRLVSDLAVPPDRVGAVGDSDGDFELLGAARVRIHVGAALSPRWPEVIHVPDGDISSIADRILELWAA